MQCSWVHDRLVALQDAELSPGERTFVLEHLDRCDACAALEAALQQVTPRDALVVPPEVQRALEIAIDAAVHRALSEPRPARAPRTAPLMRWLRRDRDLSNGAMIAYGFLLAVCLGWGTANWLAVQSMQTGALEPASVAAVEQPDPVTPARPLPSEQYQPASFTTGESDEPWR